MSGERKVVLAGATGLIGKKLVSLLREKKYRIFIISRDKDAAAKTFPTAEATIDWKDTDAIKDAVNGAYGVINLSGAPLIGRRWTEAYKKVLYSSRITPTKTLAAVLHTVRQKPDVFINGSAVGIYGMKDKQTPFIETDPPVQDVLADICHDWEQAALTAEKDGVRVVLIRTAIVLDRHEGALPKMLMPFKFYAGGPIGSGRQGFPWIHIEDEAGIIIYALEHPTVKGPVNAAAPELVTNKAFSHVLGKVLHRPSWLPVPAFVLQLLFGEAAQVLTTGVKVSPEKVIKAGYIFQHPRLEEALKSVLK